MRRLIARAVYWLAKPAIEAEIERRCGIVLSLARNSDLGNAATATAQVQYAVDCLSAQLQQAVNLLGAQDVETLRLMTEAFDVRDETLRDVVAILRRRADALPGEDKPERDEHPSPHAASKPH